MEEAVMKKILLLLTMIAVTWLMAGAVIAEQNGRSGAYSPAVTYAGSYQSDCLYVRNNGSKIIRDIPQLDRLRHVTCPDAKDHLNRDGKWQGHLAPGGSCGSYSEPAEYLMGNRLNYDDPHGED